MHWNGKLVYGLGVIPKQDIDLRNFGTDITHEIEIFNLRLVEKNINIRINLINSQPKFVSNRLNELAFSLLQSILILASFLMILMGIRVGLVVSIMLPVISLITLALYYLIGGILHQIAIAAFVMALGLLIDNVIVIVESVQEKKEKGLDSISAGSETIKEFTAPLFSSTLTTIATFLPMWMSKGSSSEFTEAIPKITMISLGVSYFAALFLSPSLSLFLLGNSKENKLPFLDKLGNFVANVVIEKPFRILIGFGIFFLIFISCIGFMKFKFFPSADRNQVIAEISFPEGTAISKTKEAVEKFEQSLLGHEEVSQITSFTGRSTPFFYYNLNQKPSAPHLAQILIESNQTIISEKLKARIYEVGNSLGARFNVRSFEQGPPVEASLIIRLYGEDRVQSTKEAERIIKYLEKNQNITQAWHNALGEQKEAIFKSDDRFLIERGLTRQDLSLALLKVTNGIPLGFYKAERESVPIVLSSGKLEKSNISDLKNALVGQTLDLPILASSVSKVEFKDVTPVFYSRNRKQYIAVLATIKYGIDPGMVASEVESFLKKEPLPNGIDWEFDGEAKESEKSNSALVAALPLGIIVLVATLLWEFNSIRLTLIILTSAPTAFMGIVPGLVFSGKPFGFLSLLALFALIGIAVNNGIILIDKFRLSEKEGVIPELAVRTGISMRLRPILLTTGSTILGMVPLTFSSSTLWPPFAWSMISGLTISTLFTLFLVPWFYLKYAKAKGKFSIPKLFTALIFLILCFGEIHSQEMKPTINLEKINLFDAITLAANSSAAKSAFHDAAAAKYGSKTATYAAYVPKFGLGGERIFRDKSLQLESPFGNLPFASRAFYQAGMELYQTLWSTDLMEFKVPAANLMAEAAAKKSIWERRSAQHNAAMAYLDCVTLIIQKESLKERKKVLGQLSKELSSLSYNGKIKEADSLKIKFSIGDIDRGITEIEFMETACYRQLGRLVGKEEIQPDATQTAWTFPQKDSGAREDLEAFSLKIQANKKEADGIMAENYPEFYAKGNLLYNDQGNIQPFSYSQVAIGVKWKILDGGTILTRHKQKLEEILSLEEQYKDAIKGVSVGITDAKAHLASAQKNYSQLKEELAETDKVIQQEMYRFLAGRTSSNSYLQVKELWLSKQELLKMKKIEMLRWEITLSFIEAKLGD